MRKTITKTAAILIFALCGFISTNMYSQAKQLWGMTPKGGQYNGGTIFKTDGSGNNQTIQHSFQSEDGKVPFFSHLTQTPDGKLWGMTHEGGANGLGVIFQYDPTGTNYTKKYDFDGINGSLPRGSLLFANDGMLYGVTESGGTNDWGVLFQYDPNNSTFTKKFDFDGTNGAHPYSSLIQASDDNLYGTTFVGGVEQGVLFQYILGSTTCISVHTFDGTDGACPLGELMETSSGNLFGMTNSGGSWGQGVLFQYNCISSFFAVRQNFQSGPFGPGGSPWGAVTLANDGMLYGNEGGVIFQYDPNSFAYNEKVVISGVNGWGAYGSLLNGSDGSLYGMTSGGNGNLYKYNPGSSFITTIHAFSGADQGSDPLGALTETSDGKLWGVTQYGGTNNTGLLFQINKDGSNYVDVHNFGEVNGSNPTGSLLLASDGNYYGMTNNGGNGVIFQFNPNTATYTTKYNFDGITGSHPYGSLIQASNGILYGMTSEGGSNNLGVIFSFDPVTSYYQTLFEFDGWSGAYPHGDLLEVGGVLHGMTYLGGSENFGVVFYYDLYAPPGQNFTTTFEFTGSNYNWPSIGKYPYGNLTMGNDGYLYGMTSGGGANEEGVLFKVYPFSPIHQKLFDFDATTTGSYPKGNLILANDGYLYGMTSAGGANDKGVLFQFNSINSNCNSMFSFDGTVHGSNPSGSLLQANDGNFYGMTHQGGANDKGVLFQYNTNTSAMNNQLNFTGANGQLPQYGNLIEITVSSATSAVSTSVCAGATLSVPYTISGGYDAGNVFTAQLSDASGSFASPVNIGNLNSTIAGTINATIPSNATLGTGYRIRVVSTSPVTIGADNGSNITVNALPTVGSTASLSTVCTGTAVTLTGTGATNYSWTGGITDATAFSASATTTYTVTGTDGNGCSNTATRLITVNALPTVGSTASLSTVCTGTAVTLTGTGATNYSWTGGITDATAFSASATTTYTVTGTDGNGCANTATRLITVNALPTVSSTVSPSATVCSGTSVTLSGTGATSYAWTGGVTNATAFTPGATTSYTVTGTDANGCVNTATRTVTVLPNYNIVSSAAANGSISPNGTSSYCGGNQTYTITPNVGYVIASVLVDGSNAGTNSTYTFNSISANHTISVTFAASGGCSSAPPTPVISGPNAVCGMTTGIYIATTTDATSYTWTVPSGITITPPSGNSSILTSYAAGTINGNITVTATNACGTSSASTFLVTKKPQPPSAISGPSSLCGQTNANYSATSFGATSYTWTLPAGISPASGSGTSSINVTIAPSFVSGNIIVTAVNSCGSVAGTSMALFGKVPAATSAIAGLTSVCGVSTITYTATGILSASSYVWTLPTGFTQLAASGNSITVQNTGFVSGSISVRGVNGCGIGASKTLALTAATATPGIISGPTVTCGLTTATYSTTLPVSGTTNFIWSLPAGATIFSGAGTASIVASFVGGMSGTVSVMANNGCVNSALRTLAVSKVPAAPTAISGPTVICYNTNYSYSINPVAGATSYLWSPSGMSILSGQGSTTINVHTGASLPLLVGGRFVRVYAQTSCGNSLVQSIGYDKCASPISMDENTEEAGTTDISVYPNPANTEFTIGLNPNQSNLELEVYDVLGNKVINTLLTNQTSTINIEQLSNGLYFVRLVDANSNIIYTQRLVKE